MPASDVDIGNLALTHLGSQRVLTFEDTTKAARSLKAIYALERDGELRDHIWNFATTRAVLPELEATPVWGFEHAYEKPADCLRIIQAGQVISPRRVLGVSTFEGGNQWSVEGQTIVTDIPAPLFLRYTRMVDDPALFDSAFVVALAYRLAMALAEDLTGIANKRQLAQAEYKAAIIAAVRSNSVELPPDTLPDGTWLLSRLPG